MKITKDNNEARYIFSWNSGEIVEVHTEETFREQWEEELKLNNQWDISFFCEFKDFDELLNDGLCNEEFVNIDNMFVIRL